MNRQSIHEFYEQLSGESSVGSGSAAALAALAGVGVLQKAARMMNRNEVAKNLQPMADKIEGYIAEDAAVMAEALPKLLHEGPNGDIAAWNAALEDASRVPQELMDTVIAVLDEAGKLVRKADINVLCDIQVGAALCNTALESGGLLADLNLTLLNCDFSLKDEGLWKLEEKRQQARDLYEEIMGLE